MNNQNPATESKNPIETKPINFPLCTEWCGGKGDIRERVERYTNSECASSKDDLLFARDLNRKLTDDDGNDYYMFDAAWRQAVLEWHRRPKLDPHLPQIDWVAFEKMAAAVIDGYEDRGKVVIALGSGRTGKTATARWLSDWRTVLRQDHVAAWMTAAEFAAQGTYRSNAVKMVETLRGVRKAYSKQYEKEFDEVYECIEPYEPCSSVIDGIGSDKLSATEAFALLAAIDDCINRGEFYLILTTPQDSPEAFIAQLAAGPNANQIVNRFNEQAVFIEFKPERVGRCPWFDDEYNLRPPYALPKDDD